MLLPYFYLFFGDVPGIRPAVSLNIITKSFCITSNWIFFNQAVHEIGVENKRILEALTITESSTFHRLLWEFAGTVLQIYRWMQMYALCMYCHVSRVWQLTNLLICPRHRSGEAFDIISATKRLSNWLWELITGVPLQSPDYCSSHSTLSQMGGLYASNPSKHYVQKDIRDNVFCSTDLLQGKIGHGEWMPNDPRQGLHCFVCNSFLGENSHHNKVFCF